MKFELCLSAFKIVFQKQNKFIRFFIITKKLNIKFLVEAKECLTTDYVSIFLQL